MTGAVSSAGSNGARWPAQGARPPSHAARTAAAAAPRRTPQRHAARRTLKAAVLVAVAVLFAAPALAGPAAAQAKAESPAGGRAPIPEPIPVRTLRTNVAPRSGFRPVHSWRRANILLMGDSLTEMGTSNKGGWATILGRNWSRRADIINRGFGGYTTKQAVQIVPEIIESVNIARTSVAVVWYGANDATNVEGPQRFMNVPLADYEANLKIIAAQLKAAGADHVMIVSPPPVDDSKRSTGGGPPDRKFDNTAMYAAAAMNAAAAAGVPGLNMFKELQAAAPDGNWSAAFMMDDGLHLSEAGNAMVGQIINDFIWREFPDARPENMPYHHPSWEEVDYSNSAEQFARERAAAS